MFEDRDIVHLSRAEARWQRRMRESFGACVRANATRLASHDNPIADVAKELFRDSRLILPSPAFKYLPKTREDGLLIPFYCWGQTENGLFVTIGNYSGGTYWPHKHGAAKIDFISGGGYGFHSDGVQHEWFEIKAGDTVDHPDGIHHGYILGNSYVIAIGARRATGNTAYASEAIMNVFNQGPPGLR